MMQENQGRPGGFRYARGYNNHLFRKRKEASLCWRPLESGDLAGLAGLAGFCKQSSDGAVQQDAGDHDGLQQGRADMVTIY
jgi:hypothetical protein